MQLRSLHSTLSSIKELLPKNQFIKVHASIIIGKNKIVLITGNLMHLNQHKIPAGKIFH
jgi:DNA-binding LytR/AlgR family response regulator